MIFKKKTVDFSGSERFVTILFEEMKIQEDLVWDKYSGELIGFVDRGDINTNFATLKYVEELATHILVFRVEIIVNPLLLALHMLLLQQQMGHPEIVLSSKCTKR